MAEVPVWQPGQSIGHGFRVGGGRTLLFAMPTLRVTLVRSDIERLTRGFGRAIRAQSLRVVNHLSETGVKFLYRLERGQGHDTLAKFWTARPARPTPRGAEGEIYSKAEGMTFFSRTGRERRRSPKYPIKGYALLRLLERGGPSHVISPRARGLGKRRALAFESRRGISASRSVGQAVTLKGVEQGRWDDPNRQAGSIFTGRVWHPGFAGNHNIRITRMLLERQLRSAAGDLARRVTLSIA